MLSKYMLINTRKESMIILLNLNQFLKNMREVIKKNYPVFFVEC